VAALPRVSADQAAEIARRWYGITGTAQRLAAEFDDAFKIVAGDGSTRLLKVSVRAPAEASGPPGPGPSFQTALLLHLAAAAPELPVQRVTAAMDGRPEVILGSRLARMTSWLDGRTLSDDGTARRGAAGAPLRRDIGGTLARLSQALRRFSHPGANRTHQWDLQHFGALRPLLDDLPPGGTLPEVSQALAASGDAAARLGRDGWLRGALSDCLGRFSAVVAPRLARTPVQVIHADFHGENLLTDGGRVTGILDFGDALTGPVAMELGIAACYQLARGPDLLASTPGRPAQPGGAGGGPGRGPDVLEPALDVVAGYHAADPLSADELSLAAEFIVARVATRIIVSQWNAIREPANRGYLLRRTPQAIGQLAALRRLTADEIAGRLRAACGM
jgi:hydroxylysine kinase